VSVEVLLQADAHELGFVVHPVEVYVVEREGAEVGVDDGEGGALHRAALDGEALRQASDELSLPGAERALELDHVAYPGSSADPLSDLAGPSRGLGGYLWHDLSLWTAPRWGPLSAGARWASAAPPLRYWGTAPRWGRSSPGRPAASWPSPPSRLR